MKDRNGRDVREAIEKLVQQIAAASGSSLYGVGREESRVPIHAKALRLLDQRMRSRKELVERLEATEEFPTSMIKEVIDNLTRSELVNNELFVSEWMRQRFTSRGESKIVLNRELKEKDISASLRTDTLEQITHNAEGEVARRLAVKRTATIKSMAPDFNSRKKDLHKVVGVLTRRGFPSKLFMNIARGRLEERYRELEEDTD